MAEQRRKAGEQLWTDIDAILADTGTDGVVLKAAGLDADAATESAVAVLTKLIADHKATGGSLADVMNDIWRRVGYGAIEEDTGDNTVVTHDAATASARTGRQTAPSEMALPWKPSV